MTILVFEDSFRDFAPRLSQQWNSVAFSLKGYTKFTLFPLHQFSQQLSIFYLIYILWAMKMTHWLYRDYTDTLSMFLHEHAIMPFYCEYITNKKVFVFFSSTDYNFFLCIILSFYRGFIRYRFVSLPMPWIDRDWSGARQCLENICSEDDLRSRIFGTFVHKFLACLSK